MSKKVLIVDDEPDIREVLDIVLSMHDYEVTAANGGDAAIEIFLKDNNFSCVITDVRMPNGNGLKVLKAVKEKSPETPVLIVSGHSDVGEEEFVAQGAHCFIQKPFDTDELIATVDKCIQDSPAGTEQK